MLRPSTRRPVRAVFSAVSLAAAAAALGGEDRASPAQRAISLDGEGWLLATDPGNSGRAEGWFREPRPEARPTHVPWIIQEVFPGYHGVAWYWRRFEAPENPWPGGRTLVRFWAVDYKADVWLNGEPLGSHEGGEAPFVFDATNAIRPGASNLLAVRVLNPTHEPIDGIVLAETPHRNKALPYSAGSAWNQGGIVDSVEVLLAPALRIDDLFVRADPRTGEVRAEIRVHNACAETVRARVELAVAPAAEGETLARTRFEREIAPGDSSLQARAAVARPRLWDLNDPCLYRATARAEARSPLSADERSVRFGFRDFRFERGAFRLNGRRIYLRSSHTGNCCPVGLELPHDPDLLRRDLLNAKVMGMNAIRFIAGVAKRYQLDLADEIGLMVYEESYAAWCLADSPRMADRYRESVLGMVLRDRNHPSVTIWGLLNETPEGPVFRRAVALLPELRALDDTRLVLLNSGRWDAHGGTLAGLEVWQDPERVDPCVTRNATDRVLRGLGITWAPGQLSFHPGRDGEYSAVRWTAPADEDVEVEASFASIAERATTDVHVLAGPESLFRAGIHVEGGGRETAHRGRVRVRAGESIVCAVGFGNGDYGADTTALAFRVRRPSGEVADAAKEFSIRANPNGRWSYGRLAPGPKPDPATFVLYRKGHRIERIGSLSNPGSTEWEDVLDDQHPYQRVPHTAEAIRALRTIGSNGLPIFISEYGVGSAVDLVRAARHYERLGKTHCEDAVFYRARLDEFLADWERWKMAEVFVRPEDFFARSNARMAGERLGGLNAIRANTNCVGYSLTGTVDQGMTGEGLWTTFREPKPGTHDALFDGFAPARLCLFVEPVNVYRGARVRLEAVLANEDAIPPGRHPVRLLVVGPGAERLFERTVEVEIPDPASGSEPPFAVPIFAEEIAAEGCSGEHRFLAAFERGAAAAGGEARFYVTDPGDMPPVEGEIVLWGSDPELAAWLAARGIRTRPFAPEAPAEREVILAGRAPQAPGGAPAFRELARRIARGSAAIFLSPEIFASGGDSARWVPLKKRGALAGLPSWLYHKDEWAKRHPIFDGLPSGDLLDTTFYRELIPDAAWVGQEAPLEAVAGANNAAQGYSAGLLVAVHALGEGRFVLNALRIRENLGSHPAAERLLRNLLRHAAALARGPLAPAGEDLERRLDALGYGG